MSNKFTEFSLPADAYAAFDASNLKKLIVDRLVDNNILTDQIYEGSNISSVIDVIAYSYHVLIYYLNRTANESMFSQSEIYENMNRIVKILNYKPLGNRASVTTFSMNVKEQLPRGIYTIPRFSFIDADGIPYSFTSDVTFSKQTDIDESINAVSESTLLYQGKFTEYPVQTSTGEPFESFVIALDESVMIDHEHINVFVYDFVLKKYVEYSEVGSLYFASPTDAVYEKRYNENQRYEIKFGDGINGSKLNAGDKVYIFYLKINGAQGKIGPGALAGKPLTLYTSVAFNNIRNDIQQANINYLNFDDVKKIQFNNDVSSTEYSTPETVENIREFSPQFFKSQNRLVTADDYYTYIYRNYGNVINDVTIVNNSTYVDKHLRYFDETLGLTRPTLESRALYNQVKYADANNTNNVHIYAVPKVVRKTSASPQISFLSPSQKELIRSGVDQYKIMTDEVVFQDPVYTAIGIGVKFPDEQLTTAIAGKTKLVLERSANAKSNAEEVKNLASNIIINYFSHNNAKLGQTIDLNAIVSQLAGLPGVQDIYMLRTDNTTFKVSGLSLLVWNPVYPNKDISVINQNLTLPYFKYPYLYDEAALFDSIDVVQAVR